jgi:co-chaperonin GroES (HSP10)
MVHFPTPMPSYFLIRIARKEERKQKIGSIIIPETQTFMMYNLQAGEIVAIGKRAAEYFPEAKVGHTLLCHHFVQGLNEHDAREDHLIHQDETYNYYVVTCFDFHRKSNETYGIWDGEKIIPNKDYIFLNIPKKDDPKTPDEYINSAIKQTPGGIITFTSWTESRETKAEKMQRLKSEIQELSKSGAQKPHIAQGIKVKEVELEQLSLNLNSKSYQEYTVTAFNPDLKYSLPEIEVGGPIFVLNIAAQTEIDFMNNKYIVCKINYIGCC